jgi:hypothetical protein
MKRNILSHSTHHTSSHKATYPFFFFSVLRELDFTGTLTILGGILRLLTSNISFSQKLNIQGVPEISDQKENCISPTYYDQMS